MPPGGYAFSYEDEELALGEAPPPTAPVAQDKYSAGGYETNAAPAPEAAPAAAPAPEAAPAAEPPPAAPAPAAEPQYAADNPYSETMPASASGSAPAPAREQAAAPDETDAPPPAKPSGGTVMAMNTASQYGKGNVYTTPAPSQAKGADAAGSAGITPAPKQVGSAVPRTNPQPTNPYTVDTGGAVPGTGEGAGRAGRGVEIGRNNKPQSSAWQQPWNDANFGKVPPVEGYEKIGPQPFQPQGRVLGEQGRQAFQGAGTTNFQGTDAKPTPRQDPGNTTFAGDRSVRREDAPETSYGGEGLYRPMASGDGGYQPKDLPPVPTLSELAASKHDYNLPGTLALGVGVMGEQMLDGFLGPGGPGELISNWWNRPSDQPVGPLASADAEMARRNAIAQGAAGRVGNQRLLTGGIGRDEVRGTIDSVLNDPEVAAVLETNPDSTHMGDGQFWSTRGKDDPVDNRPLWQRLLTDPPPATPGDPMYGRTPAVADTRPVATGESASLAAQPRANNTSPVGQTSLAGQPRANNASPVGQTSLAGQPRANNGTTPAGQTSLAAQPRVGNANAPAPAGQSSLAAQPRANNANAPARRPGGSLPGSAADQIQINAMTGGTTGRNAAPTEIDAPPPSGPQTLGQERERVGETTPQPVEGGGFFDGLGGFARDKWDGATGKIGDANMAAWKATNEHVIAPIAQGLGGGSTPAPAPAGGPKGEGPPGAVWNAAAEQWIDPVTSQPVAPVERRPAPSFNAPGDRGMKPKAPHQIPEAVEGDIPPPPRPKGSSGAVVDGFGYVEGAVLGTEGKIPHPPQPNSKIGGEPQPAFAKDNARRRPPVQDAEGLAADRVARGLGVDPDKAEGSGSWIDNLATNFRDYYEDNQAAPAFSDAVGGFFGDARDIVTGKGTIREKAAALDDRTNRAGADVVNRLGEAKDGVAAALGPDPRPSYPRNASPSQEGQGAVKPTPAAAKATADTPPAAKKLGEITGKKDDWYDVSWVKNVNSKGEVSWIAVTNDQTVETGPDGKPVGRPRPVLDAAGKPVAVKGNSKPSFQPESGGVNRPTVEKNPWATEEDPVAAADVPAAAPAPAASSSSGSGDGSSSSSGSGWVDYPKKSSGGSSGGGWSRSSGGSSGGGGGWSRSSSSGKSSGRWPFGGSDGDHVLDAKGGKWKFDSKTGMWVSSDGRRSRKRPKGRLVKGRKGGMFGQRPESGVFNPSIFDRYKDVSGQDLSWGPVSDGMVGGVPVAGAPVEFGTPPPTHPARAGKAGKRKG